MAVEPALLEAWLAGRSGARGLPAPHAERGGYRVETASEKEIRRWVFPSALPAIRDLCAEIEGPCQPVKLCGEVRDLELLVPPGWSVAGGSAFMIADLAIEAAPLPADYVRFVRRDGAIVSGEIRTARGELAASGFAAETADAFVYDRIETDPAHRRIGLGRAVMGLLSECREVRSLPQLLVATREGERLYSALGWRSLSPYSTAVIPDECPASNRRA